MSQPFDQSHFLNVLSQVNELSKKNGQKVKVVAVTKTFPIETIEAALAIPFVDFGENYVQEFDEKKQHFKQKHSPIRWHMIGRIQSNKIKKIFGECELVHSVDRLELFQKAKEYCERANVKQKILLQINAANEDSKAGFNQDELEAHLQSWLKQTSLLICGFTTMPPLQNQPEDNRQYFKSLKQLKERLAKYSSITHPLNELSMGTSHDFHVAIEEGSTIVRLGTILFGGRS